MPQKEYVINLENNKMTTYRYRMHQEDLKRTGIQCQSYAITRNHRMFI